MSWVWYRLGACFIGLGPVRFGLSALVGFGLNLAPGLVVY